MLYRIGCRSGPAIFEGAAWRESCLCWDRHKPHLVLQDGDQLAELIQDMELNEGRPQQVVQQCAQRVHQGRHSTAVPSFPGKEVVEQLVLRCTHLHSRRTSACWFTAPLRR